MMLLCGLALDEAQLPVYTFVPRGRRAVLA
jgi:hypothetical protein